MGAYPEADFQRPLRSGFAFGGWLPSLVGSAHEPPPLLTRDERFMSMAVTESLKAVGYASPNPAVGCVVVKDDAVVARGHTQKPGGAHAERMAYGALGGWPQGCEVFVTLEPCSFFGRTPPCTDLFLNAQNVRVVVGCLDPNPRVAGAGVQLLERVGLTTTVGVLRNEVTATLLPFFYAMGQRPWAPNPEAFERSLRPFVGLKWAQSLDGAMADQTGRSQWLTGSTAARYSHWLRQKYDAVAVGWGTLVADKPRLNVRHVPEGCVARDPLRVVLDPKNHMAQVDPTNFPTLFQSEGGPWLVLSWDASRQASEEPSAELVQVPAAGGADVPTLAWVQLPGADEGLWLKSCLAWLASQGHKDLGSQFGDREIQSLMVEGGPSLHGLFWRHGLCDILHGWLSPLMLGQSPFRWLPDEPVALAEAPRATLLQSHSLGQDVLCEWLVP
jgi:diaminohydroxyphosphoribosylaminopyrimidine deaminase/5-amino-6-(5-phosphoribosylamino)uracil reductase